MQNKVRNPRVAKMDIDIDVAIKNTLRHVRAHEMKQKSKSELAYSSALSESIADMNNIRRHANLDKILIYEQALMHHDLERYTENAKFKKMFFLELTIS